MQQILAARKLFAASGNHIAHALYQGIMWSYELAKPAITAKLKRNQWEVKLNQKVKGLIQRLGEAIHETVSESEHVAGVVKDIREQGFDVMLMLEATIGLNEVHETESAAGNAPAAPAGEGPFTPHDLSFLKSLRISISESESQPEDSAYPGSSDGRSSTESASGEQDAT